MEKVFLPLFLIGFLLIGVVKPQVVSDYKIIVNTSNRVSSIKVTQLSKYFLKKTTRWHDGKKIFPVDFNENNPVRKKFTKDILAKKVSEIKAYWQRQIFTGRGVPPPEFGSEANVLKYVQEHEGAIGYLSVSTPLKGYNVKVIEIVK